MKGAFTILGLFLAVLVLLVGVLFWQEKTVAKQIDETDIAIESPVAITRSTQAFILSPANVNYLPIRDFNIAEPVVDARAAIVYDMHSGRTLFSHNPDEKLPIASITKLMTAVVVIENLDLNSVYTVSVEDLNVDGFGADLYRGEKIVGEDLFKIMLINSANDAAAVFATIFQEQDMDILEAMNSKAQKLGMYSTNFNDPAGLDDNSTYSTANDVIRLVRYVERYPEIWEILRTETDEVTSFDGKIRHRLVNTNRLLGVLEGIIGGKTGMSDGALGTLTLVVDVKDGKESIVTVLLGTNYRFDESKELIDWTKSAHSWE